MTLRPCIACGEPSERTRCDQHAITAPPKTTATARGYDTQWRTLSEQARRLQPWCSECGTTLDLTADHSEEAWQRKAAGKGIRLVDIDVLCRSCNARKGRARPASPLDTTGVGQADTRPDPLVQSKFGSHSGDHS